MVIDPPETPLLPPRYELRSVIYESAARLVCLAFDAVQRREVAIKVLRHPMTDEQELMHFRSEFATLASLEHPNIVRVFDFGLQREGFPYFTMEYVEGRRISEYFDGRNWESLYDVVLRVISALHFVHTRGVCHLDVKPSNILVTKEGEPKLMDFGLALEENRLFDRSIRGTLQYIAPEILKQDAVDCRADLYALGMTLYETVTGALPGYGRAAIDVMRMHLEEEIRPPSAINPQVPPELDRIIMRLLEKDPRHRFQSAAALLHAVADAAGRPQPSSDLLLGPGELLTAPLIGRSAEVEQLMSLVDAAREGRGGGVVVAGAEGIGKTRVVREVALRAQMGGARVVTGRCPMNRKTIYAPFFEIFRQLVAAVSPRADALEEVRRILRPLAPAAGIHARSPQQGQKFRLYNRIVQSIEDIYGFLRAADETSASPLIVVVDDLQWADASTAELFAFLISEAKKNMMLVIGTIDLPSDPDAAAAILAMWEQRSRDADFPLVRLEPLAEPVVREHIAAILGAESIEEEFVRWMAWESGGSPLAVRRILTYLVDQSLIRWESDGWTIDLPRIRVLRLPGGAASLLLDRVERLAASQKGIVEAAAVLGKTFDLTLLSAVSDLAAEETWDGVSELVKSGLFDQPAGESIASFPQMHVRDAVYNSMPERRRSELHERVARALEQRVRSGATQLIGQIAYHFARANDVEKGIACSIEAGDMATRTLAFGEAVEFYRSALDLIELAGDDPRRTEVREKLADALYRGSDYRGAMQAYQFLLRSGSAGSDAAEGPDAARLLKKIGKVLERRGDHDSALSYFHSALEAFERLGDPHEVAELLNRIAGLHREKAEYDLARAEAGRALAMLEHDQVSATFGYVKDMLGTIEYAVGNWERSRELLLEAYGIGEAIASVQLMKAASTNLGNTLWKLGDWDTALRFFRKNLEVSEAEGDLFNLATAYNNVGVVEFGRGDFPAAAESFARSSHLAHRTGAADYESTAKENLGEALEMMGRWDEALELYRDCLSMEGFDEARPARAAVLVPLARLMNKKGDVARALEYAHRALTAGERARDGNLAAEASYVLASIEDERENLEEADRHLKRAMAIFEESRTLHGIARAHVAAATIALRRTTTEDAVAHVERARAIAAELRDRFTLAKTDWAWGKILCHRDDRDSALQRLELARAAFEQLHTEYEQARVVYDIGVLRDDPDEATATIRDSVRTFERLEARHDLERARGALARIRPAGRMTQAAAVVGLYEVVKIINSSLDLTDVLHRVLDIAIRRLRAERGMIILLDPITNALRTRVVRNINEAEASSKRSPQSVVREVVRTGHVVMSADAAADERFSGSESVIVDSIRSILCVPLVMKDRIAGAIYVDHRETRHLFSHKDVTFLEAFADQAAIAIENARLYEELAEAKARLSLENESLRREVLVEKHLDSIVGVSDAVAKIQYAVRRSAAGASTVLLRGESGTGKGLIARIIHNMGPRRNGPFINFNCAALPETLAESELFGHEKGAFTGADRRKLGRFELASGGTIFLDEIGKITMAMQAKLLRVIEEKEFERVGGTQTIRTDAKVIAATNLDMESAIQNGTFREDLFYRLNIIPIHLAPLRERKDDIPLLVEHFVKKISRDLGIEPKHLAHGVLDLFLDYDWPGNVRELEATIHRAMVMSSSDELTREDFYALVGREPSASPVPSTPPQTLSLLQSLSRVDITGELYEGLLSNVDRQLIRRALEMSGGRIREAARRLGIARNTLKAKMQRYDLAGRD